MSNKNARHTLMYILVWFERVFRIAGLLPNYAGTMAGTQMAQRR
jgi:hypothetical protein